MKIWPLESLRGLVALYVVLHHARLFDRGGWGNIFYFGQEAVILFFLLSGFVIEYSMARKKISPKSYIISRFFRIYPIFIFALLLAYVSDVFLEGKIFSPDWRLLCGNMLMLQDISSLKPGVWFDTFSGNSPLWSLSYEWWFYVMYMFIVLLWKKTGDQGTFISGVISLFGFVGFYFYPAQPFLFMNYFIVWWSGVIMAREFYKNGFLSFKGQLNTLTLIAAMVLLWGGVVYFYDQKINSFGEYPFLQLRHFSSSLALIFFAIIFLKFKIPVPMFFLRPFVWFGSISYAIYVVHQPILNIVSVLMVSSNVYYRFIFAIIFIVFVSWILEVKIQPVISSWAKKMVL